MARIVYLGFPNGGISGGQKVSLRHVEALRGLGFDAVFWTNAASRLPAWLDHAHRRLDAAVAAAYGWPADLPDEEVLARLFALNQERAAAGR